MPSHRHANGTGFRRQRRSLLPLERLWQLLGRRFAPIQRARAHLGLRAGQTAVEFCGGGASLYEVLSRQVGDQGRVYVVETDARSYRRLQKRIQRRGMGNVIPLLLQEARLPLNTRTADLILVADFFNRVLDQAEFFRELHRVVKPNGRLLLVRAGQPPEALRNAIERARCWQVTAIEQGVYTCVPRYVKLSPPPVERRQRQYHPGQVPGWPAGEERRRRTRRPQR